MISLLPEYYLFILILIVTLFDLLLILHNYEGYKLLLFSFSLFDVNKGLLFFITQSLTNMLSYFIQ
jgi:hypothetical protein